MLKSSSEVATTASPKFSEYSESFARYETRTPNEWKSSILLRSGGTLEEEVMFVSDTYVPSL